MWNKWEHEKGKPLKAEKYKKKALEEYEKVKKDLQHIIDDSQTEEEIEDLCYEFIEKW